MKKRNYTLTTALTAALCCLICLLNGCTRDNDIDSPDYCDLTNNMPTVAEYWRSTGRNHHSDG